MPVRKKRKVENGIVGNDKYRQPTLTDDEAHQLLKELQMEEVTLKQLIYEFTQELQKTKMEEAMLRNLIEQQKQSQTDPNTAPLPLQPNPNSHPKHEQDDEDIDVQNTHQFDQEREELDGDTLLRDMFASVLQGN